MQTLVMRFFDLLERSIILQAIITAGVLGAAVYRWIVGLPLTEEHVAAMWLILGYWFGTKAQHSIDVHRAKREG